METSSPHPAQGNWQGHESCGKPRREPISLPGQVDHALQLTVFVQTRPDLECRYLDDAHGNPPAEEALGSLAFAQNIPHLRPHRTASLLQLAKCPHGCSPQARKLEGCGRRTASQSPGPARPPMEWLEIATSKSVGDVDRCGLAGD